MTMAKQTRRSISISNELYDGLQLYCAENNRTGSDVVETELRKVLGIPARVRPPKSRSSIQRLSTETKEVSVHAEPEIDDQFAENSTPATEPAEDSSSRRARVLKEADERRKQS